MRRAMAVGAALGSGLACSGLLGGEQEVVNPIPDYLAGVEAARRDNGFARAENLVRKHLATNPRDAAAWKMLGDVNLTRSQRYQKKWKENVLGAREAYREALVHDPQDCALWNRMALTVAVGANQADLAASEMMLDALPRAVGATACPKTAGLILLDELRPRDAALARAREALGPDATDAQVLARAAPELVSAYARFELGTLPWELAPRPAPAAGLPFLVLDLPMTAAGVNGAVDRQLQGPEWVTISRVAGDAIQFTDRQVPARKPRVGRVDAAACPGTSWTMGSDNRPLGACRPGPWKPGISPVYNPDILKKANLVYYRSETIDPATVSADAVISSSVQCEGGGFGPMFKDRPSCGVTYDEPIYQTRALPLTAGFTALDPVHAGALLTARDRAPVYGDEAARHLSLGEHAVGMPYSTFLYGRPDVSTCLARPLLQRTVLDDGAMLFTCTVAGWDYTFREFKLVAAAPAGAPQ